MTPYMMVLDEEMQILFVGTREGLVVFFDVSHSHDFVMVHYLKLTKPGSRNFIKQMDLDKTKNILMCRMKSSDIICIQLIRSNVQKSTVIEKVQTYGSSYMDKDEICKFKWLSRMSMYVEGTRAGLIKIRDIQKAGELVMHLPADFK